MLTLPIKKKWFDMILSGDKKEEYREINPYYETRFNNLFGWITVGNRPIPAPLPELQRNLTQLVMFRNGYSSDIPAFVAECSLSVGTGKPEWGAELGKNYYVLTIKEVKT